MPHEINIEGLPGDNVMEVVRKYIVPYHLSILYNTEQHVLDIHMSITDIFSVIYFSVLKACDEIGYLSDF